MKPRAKQDYLPSHFLSPIQGRTLPSAHYIITISYGLGCVQQNFPSFAVKVLVPTCRWSSTSAFSAGSGAPVQQTHDEPVRDRNVVWGHCGSLGAAVATSYPWARRKPPCLAIAAPFFEVLQRVQQVLPTKFGTKGSFFPLLCSMLVRAG